MAQAAAIASGESVRFLPLPTVSTTMRISLRFNVGTLDVLHISLQESLLAVSCVSVQFLQSVCGDPMNAARR